MKDLDEKTALAIVFGNTMRKKRREDLVTLAKAFKYLIKLHHSQKSVADMVGLSTEMIRQFLTVLKLPAEVQKIFSNRIIDSVDIAKELAALKDPRKQIIAAKTLADSPSKDFRDIKRIIKNTNLDVEDAKKRILETKTKGLHVFVVDFDENTYMAIKKHAYKLKIEPAEFVRQIVVDYLNRNIRKRGKRG
jgi:predicted transcriptional regulator